MIEHIRSLFQGLENPAHTFVILAPVCKFNSNEQNKTSTSLQ